MVSDVVDFEIEAIKLAALNTNGLKNRLSVELTDKQAYQIKHRSSQLRHETEKANNLDDRKQRQVEACWEQRYKKSKKK